MTDTDIKKIERNMQLCKKFPFLVPTHWTGVPIKDYDYSYVVGFMDTPWEKIWLEFCEEILPEYQKLTPEEKERFFFHDTKEKYGTMRISMSYTNDAIWQAILNAEFKSKFTCSKCGAQPRSRLGNHIIYLTKGWVQFLCKDCAKEHFKGKLPKDSCRRITHGKKFYINRVSDNKQVLSLQW